MRYVRAESLERWFSDARDENGNRLDDEGLFDLAEFMRVECADNYHGPYREPVRYLVRQYWNNNQSAGVQQVFDILDSIQLFRALGERNAAAEYATELAVVELSVLRECVTHFTREGRQDFVEACIDEIARR